MSPDLLHRARRVIRDAERGISAVILAISMTLMMAAAAIGFDIAKLYYEKQLVRNTVDTSAQYGAAQLRLVKNGSITMSTMISMVQTFALRNYNDNTPNRDARDQLSANDVKVYFLCIVGNKDSSHRAGTDKSYVNSTQIPGTCNPHGYDSGPSQVNCSSTSCAIKCGISSDTSYVPDVDGSTDKCNALKVSISKRVSFVFAPAINIPYGTTGAVSTLSCSGGCGGLDAPNPMNVVVMADRTPSMDDSHAPTGSFAGLKSGLKQLLTYMNADQQYVAFGAIHKSVPHSTSGNLATPPNSGDNLYTYTSTDSYSYSNQVTGTRYNSQTKCESYGYYWVSNACYKTRTTTTTSTRNNQFNGTWVPVGFTNTYNNKSDTVPHGEVTTTDIYKSIDQLTYSSNNTMADGTVNGIGTHLAAALKGAARYLQTNVDSNNYVPALDVAGTTRKDLPVKPRNVIVFETDGRPEEIFSSSASAVNLTDDADIGAQGDGEKGCNNFKAIADLAKAKGYTIITIGFGNAAKYTCAKGSYAGTGSLYNSGSMYVDDVLAYAASSKDGVAAKANYDCADTSPGGGKDQENNDGDNFYCAANGQDLQTVFTAAMGDLDDSTQFMSIPGVAD